ncbi:hypothetical protein TNCV_2837511 [Trichonephila clavipes]|nr:hypothetical protein TNCV_2837511 [Trichonephila clavipes]
MGTPTVRNVLSMWRRCEATIAGLGEDTDVCKCFPPLLQNSCRVACPLVRLVEEEERWESSDHPQSVPPKNCGGAEHNRIVTCMVIKVPCHDEFRGS